MAPHCTAEFVPRSVSGKARLGFHKFSNYAALNCPILIGKSLQGKKNTWLSSACIPIELECTLGINKIKDFLYLGSILCVPALWIAVMVNSSVEIKCPGFAGQTHRLGMVYRQF